MATPPHAPPPDPSEGAPGFEGPDAIVDELDAAERGFVLGVLLGGDSDGGGATATAGLESPSRERCADAVAAIGRLARAQRVRLTRALAHDVVPSFPAGIEAVDPSYLRAIFDDEAPAIVGLIGREAPPAVQAAVTASLNRRATAPGAADPDRDTDPDLPAAFASGADTDRDLPAGDTGAAQPATLVMRAATSSATTAPPPGADVSPDLLADLRRAVLAKVVSVPPASAGALPRSWSRRLALLPGSELVAHLTRRGAEVVGVSLQGSSGEILLRSAALVGPPCAAWMLAAGRRPAGSDADLGLDRAGARAVVAATCPALDPRETLARVGAREVGARLISASERGLAGMDVVVALAQRLPSGIAGELLAAAGAVTLPAGH